MLAQIYYFKPQTLSVSTLFLLILSYWLGNAMHIALPSKGLFRYLNPGPFNSKFRVTRGLRVGFSPRTVSQGTCCDHHHVLDGRRLCYCHSGDLGSGL